MPVEETVYFDTDKLIEGRTAKLTYKGKLAQNGAEEIYVHYGFGLLWENLQEIKLSKTEDNTFEAEINMQQNDSINFCFRDNNNNWDNNDTQNYSFPITKEEVTVTKVETVALEVPKLKKSYILAKKIKITFYKIITFIPKVFTGDWRKKAKE